MTTDPIASARTAIAPVIDYEPPARASTPCRPAPPPVPAPPARQHRGQLPRRRPDRPSRNGLPPPLQSAAVFADAALRRVLEIVDGRRPPAHLQPLLAAGLAESVLAVRPHAVGRAEPATLQRVRVRPAGSAEPTTAVEAFGTYRRGRRTHALACRIERVPASGTGAAWRIVALHIG
ncbi:Rv3235 family protein [[Mycobacterium] crassicus]|uniref:Rv3235 family protein n=1 Tax=[Mycobacterium] crassicus TaxID=2872309 RepID=A0ABU5XCG3_9MYCO|nr:Rv3235 family protein [Mycolicibacter sp. MYC098]MEB3019995.1 Rv3235 family protein [Mycolicibacter sp. MYC098]